MNRKANFFLIFALSILCGFVACHKIQIAQEERPPQEKAQQEKKVQRKTIPQEKATHKEGFLAGIFRRIIPQDTFTHIFAIDFDSFHGKANPALQDSAKTHKGNSFQVSRLGSDAVILKGVYLREIGREKYVSTLTIKPIASRRSQLEIKFDSSAGASSSSNTDEAAKEIFRIIEESTGKAAQ